MTRTRGDQSAADSGAGPPRGEAPYRYQVQFEHVMDEACSRYMRTHGKWFERRGPYFVLAVYIVLVIPGVTIASFGTPLLGPIVFLSMLLVPVLLIGHQVRARRHRRRILRERLCLNCFYPLHAAPLDGESAGACPECGAPFSARQYERPPKRIHRYPVTGERTFRAES